ncbi:MAG: hypothetical protein ACLFQB_01830 [Chitinispirillaceae bacterium]
MGTVKKTLLSLTVAAVSGTIYRYLSFRRKRTQKKLTHKTMKAGKYLEKRFGKAVKNTRKGLNQMVKMSRKKAAARA